MGSRLAPPFERDLADCLTTFKKSMSFPQILGVDRLDRFVGSRLEVATLNQRGNVIE